MSQSRSAPLADWAKNTCSKCGVVVWTYETPTGNTVSVSDEPGPWLIDAHGRAWKSLRSDGFSAHACAPLGPFVGTVSLNEFFGFAGR